MRVRPLLVTVHRWVGLIAALFLVVLGVTGAVMAFETPLDDALNARLHLVTPRGSWLPVPELVRRLEATHPGYRVTEADFGQDGRHADAVSLEAADGKPELDLFVDPYDATVLGSVSESRDWLRPMHQFHTHLLANGPWGRTVVGWAAVALGFLALFGLVLWWPAKIFRPWRGNGLSSWRGLFDLHNALGGLSWIFLLVFAATGMVLHWSGPAMDWATRLTGVTPPANFPRSAPQCIGAPAQLPLDRIYDAAVTAVPGARVTTVLLPDSMTRPARVIMKFPEDRTPAGRTNVFVASCTGTVIEARSSRAAPAAYRAVAMWTREMHTGDIGGWPTRLLASLASLSGAAMAVTGPLMWWWKRKERASG